MNFQKSLLNVFCNFRKPNLISYVPQIFRTFPYALSTTYPFNNHITDLHSINCSVVFAKTTPYNSNHGATGCRNLCVIVLQWSNHRAAVRENCLQFAYNKYFYKLVIDHYTRLRKKVFLCWLPYKKVMLIRLVQF